jgi:hypothetical protein
MYIQRSDLPTRTFAKKLRLGGKAKRALVGVLQ